MNSRIKSVVVEYLSYYLHNWTGITKSHSVNEMGFDYGLWNFAAFIKVEWVGLFWICNESFSLFFCSVCATFYLYILVHRHKHTLFEEANLMMMMMVAMVLCLSRYIYFFQFIRTIFGCFCFAFSATWSGNCWWFILYLHLLKWRAASLNLLIKNDVQCLFHQIFLALDLYTA